MKKQSFYLVLLFVISFYACKTRKDPFETAFEPTKEIEQMLNRMTFGEKEYNILDFGAVANDENILSHEAINKAIETCNEEGGGKVIVPAGVFYTGPICIKSNVNLHLEDEAILKFSPDLELYFPVVLTRWEGVDCYNMKPLIYAYGEENIAITGKGIIDGQGSIENWWPMCGAVRYGWKEGMLAQRNGGRDKLLMYAETETPIDERIMTKEDALRPQLVNLYKCSNILIEDVTLLNSPFWVIHPLMCENIIVRGVTIFNRGPNGDGCDPESCKNVLIENCEFDTGDDCIAIKSGRNNDGRKWNMPSENIWVRNCHMKNGHGGVVIGSEISGGFKNLYVEDCTMDSPQLDRVIRIKTNNCRGGIVENIWVRNITVGECNEAVLRINLLYENKEDCNRAFDPIVRNVHLKNITCNKSKYGIIIDGMEGKDLVYDITLDDCKFYNVQNHENRISGARDVHLNEVYYDDVLIKIE
ncbi:MAG: glycoside hydrolase family 28 protein [Bacteroidales bacterium]|nr:glycoside hydrolase family 28 protein [Bacteroidales bacterium]